MFRVYVNLPGVICLRKIGYVKTCLIPARLPASAAERPLPAKRCPSSAPESPRSRRCAAHATCGSRGSRGMRPLGGWKNAAFKAGRSKLLSFSHVFPIHAEGWGNLVGSMAKGWKCVLRLPVHENAQDYQYLKKNFRLSLVWKRSKKTPTCWSWYAAFRWLSVHIYIYT